MRRLLKLVVAAALIATIVYVLRNRLVPAPQEPTAEPARFRVAPESRPVPHQATAAASAAPTELASETAGTPTAGTTAYHDLTEVKGIGPVYFGRLVEAGITTLDGLAAAAPADVAGWAGVSEEAAAGWIAQAHDLAAG